MSVDVGLEVVTVVTVTAAGIVAATEAGPVPGVLVVGLTEGVELTIGLDLRPVKGGQANPVDTGVCLRLAIHSEYDGSDRVPGCLTLGVKPGGTAFCLTTLGVDWGMNRCPVGTFSTVGALSPTGV